MWRRKPPYKEGMIMGIEVLLTFLTVLYAVGILCITWAISVARYPRVIKRTAFEDLLSLMIMIGMLFWVVSLR